MFRTELGGVGDMNPQAERSPQYQPINELWRGGEWQTREIQNLLSSLVCGFESSPHHEL